MIERSVVELAARLRERGRPFTVATVVAVAGSAYRRPGAKLVFAGDERAGSISGGELDGDVLRTGALRARGGPVVIAADGCQGMVEVLVERGGEAGCVDPLAIAERCWRAQRRCAIATVFRGGPIGARVVAFDDGELAVDPGVAPALREHIAADAWRVLADAESARFAYEGVDVFVELVRPPPRVFVFGAGFDAPPVVALAAALGWEVERPIGEPVELAPRVDATDTAACVVMNHDYARDRACVATLVRTRARYIGVLGPRSRLDRMLAELELAPDARVHGPAGLALGGDTPEAIALAIVAEIQTCVGGVAM